MPTIADVAKHAGVSPTQVSFVLNRTNLHMVSRERQGRIEESIRALGYRPNIAARQLAGKQSHIIGVIMHTHVSQVSFNRLAVIEGEASQRGYQIMVSGAIGSADAMEAKADALAAYDLDGLICIAHDYPDDPEAVPRRLSRYPNVVYLEKPAVGKSSWVEIDFACGSQRSVEYLLKKGRRCIGLCMPDLPYRNIHDRRRAYLEAHEQAGLTVNKDLVVLVDMPESQKVPNLEETCQLIESLVRQGRTDAIIAYNDLWAARILQVLLAQGVRVPDDVALVGFDNLEIGELLMPDLTTVDQHNAEVARGLVELLVEQIERGGEREAPRRVRVQPTLISRHSA